MKKDHDLLLVIDMQNVYLPGEEWACPSMPQAIASVQRLLEADAPVQAVFTKFVAPVRPEGTWKQYNRENRKINSNEYLGEIVTELQPYLGRWPVYEKSTYSSFKVDRIIEMAQQAEHVLLSGVVAECCVLATMMEAIDMGHKVIYLTDCISGQSEQNEACIIKIAESFSAVHTLVMDSKSYLQREIYM